MMAANNIDLQNAQKESCSHLKFQESELLLNEEFLTQFRFYRPTMKEKKNHKRLMTEVRFQLLVCSSV